MAVTWSQHLDFRLFRCGSWGKTAILTWMTSQEHWSGDLTKHYFCFQMWYLGSSWLGHTETALSWALIHCMLPSRNLSSWILRSKRDVGLPQLSTGFSAAHLCLSAIIFLGTSVSSHVGSDPKGSMRTGAGWEIHYLWSWMYTGLSSLTGKLAEKFDLYWTK